MAAEFALPYYMMRGLSRSPLAKTQWDGVVWYSPSIFLGPLIKSLKRASNCKSYLVLRDIFPDWAADTGVLNRGPAFRLLKLVQRYQFSVSDIIGVQTPANLPFLNSWARRPGRRLEVLHNWLAPSSKECIPPFVERSRLRNRTLFVYAGNMGIAQDMEFIVALAERMREREDVGFLFVGRGTAVSALRQRRTQLDLKNVEFYDEVDPSLIPGLLAKCHVGIVALDPRHTTHNIPGKFLTYLQAGLPVLARINPGNDLENLINSKRVGRAYTGCSLEEFERVSLDLLANREELEAMGRRGRELAKRLFSVEAAASQVVRALRARPSRTCNESSSGHRVQP
ncbi:MAG TPA: glycosyltransferase family 4 protein [Gemmatimonadaceae bacterium]|nr:glycosyltransferase family 4 protein [Gemmatimonadaceae bacterium]